MRLLPLFALLLITSTAALAAEDYTYLDGRKGFDLYYLVPSIILKTGEVPAVRSEPFTTQGECNAQGEKMQSGWADDAKIDASLSDWVCLGPRHVQVQPEGTAAPTEKRHIPGPDET